MSLGAIHACLSLLSLQELPNSNADPEGRHARQVTNSDISPLLPGPSGGDPYFQGCLDIPVTPGHPEKERIREVCLG